jgi:hypothetical protein
MRKVPTWIMTLATDVCADANRPVPRIVYRVAKFGGVSGTCYGGHIALTMNRTEGRRGQKSLVLHELAHWTCGPGHWHDDVWAATYVRLMKHYGLPTRGERYNSIKRELKRRRFALPGQAPAGYRPWFRPTFVYSYSAVKP